MAIDESRVAIQIKRLKRRVMVLRMEMIALILVIGCFFVSAGAVIFMNDKILDLSSLNPERDRIMKIGDQIERIDKIIQETIVSLKDPAIGNNDRQTIFDNLHKLHEEQRALLVASQPGSDLDLSFIVREYITRFAIFAIMLLATGIYVGFYRNAIRMYVFYTSRIDVLEFLAGQTLPASIVLPVLTDSPDVEFGRSLFSPTHRLGRAISRFRPSLPQ